MAGVRIANPLSNGCGARIEVLDKCCPGRRAVTGPEFHTLPDVGLKVELSTHGPHEGVDGGVVDRKRGELDGCGARPVAAPKCRYASTKNSRPPTGVMKSANTFPKRMVP